MKKIFLLILLPAILMPIFAAEAGEQTDDRTYNLQVDIPGMGGTVNMSEPGIAIGSYISAIYNYALGIVGILSALVIMIGGVIWLTAGGNTNRIENAKSWITAALTGLVIALSSYAILYTVNPDLVKLQITENIEDYKGEEMEFENPKGCCDKGDGSCMDNVTFKKCKEEYSGTFKGEQYECGEPTGRNQLRSCVKK
jgi:hypothetical protein